jgi:hypothetical protein
VSLLLEGPSAPVGLLFEEAREEVRVGAGAVSISVKSITEQ